VKNKVFFINIALFASNTDDSFKYFSLTIFLRPTFIDNKDGTRIIMHCFHSLVSYFCYSRFL